MKKIALLLLFFLSFLLGILLVSSVSATPVCSFTYSVKGCNIYLTPSLSDVAYYEWTIAPDDGTTILGSTGWIPGSSVFTQMFSMDHEGVYRVSLSVRNITGATSGYSMLIRTMGSALSVVPAGQAEVNPVNQSFTDKFMAWFDSFPAITQGGIIIMVVFLGIISIDVVFHVSRDWEKKIFYKTEGMKK